MLNESYRIARAFIVASSVAKLVACSSTYESAGSSDEPAPGTTHTATTDTAGTAGPSTGSGASGGMGSSTTTTGSLDATTGTTGTTGSSLVHCDLERPECQCDVEGCFLIQGASCTQAADCKTQICGVTQEATNICCAAVCEQGQVCTEDGSGCEIEGACDEADQRCSAEGNHERCTDGLWQLVTDCGTRGCSVELTGGCLGDLGAPCLEDSECGVGTCKETTDGSSVCCDASCGDCLVCTQAGSDCQDPDFIKPDCNCTAATAFACDDTIPCTDDACDGGRCTNVLQSGYCLIDDECFDHNEQEKDDPCRYCDSALRDRAWTNSPTSVSCDDGAWCNGVDTCNGSGECQHEFRADRCTEDGPCALGTCDEARDSCYEHSSEICLQAGMFACSSTSCGGDVLGHLVITWCSGTSNACDGLTDASAEWEITEVCSATQKCNESTLTCQNAPECE